MIDHLLTPLCLSVLFPVKMRYLTYKIILIARSNVQLINGHKSSSTIRSIHTGPWQKLGQFLPLQESPGWGLAYGSLGHTLNIKSIYLCQTVQILYFTLFLQLFCGNSTYRPSRQDIFLLLSYSVPAQNIYLINTSWFPIFMVCSSGSVRLWIK